MYAWRIWQRENEREKMRKLERKWTENKRMRFKEMTTFVLEPHVGELCFQNARVACRYNQVAIAGM